LTPVPTLEDIRRAAALLEGAIIRTPLLPAPKLSELTGAEVLVKYENLQVTNSFKERGAYVKLLSLDEAARTAGVIAMSAGNHAQAVAYHARRLGIPATIVMPVTTPFVKVAATKAHGAQVVLAGETLAESHAVCRDLAERDGLTLVHPYDDPAVIAGQGTIAVEMIEQSPGLDDLVIPVGGGGLISGCAIAAKALQPSIRITGVEVESYSSMAAALEGREAACGGPTLAEGIAVKNVGRLTLEIVRRLVDRVVLVSETEIERAVFAFLTLQKTMAEGAGAAGLAALLKEPTRYGGRKVGLVLCGGNIDPRVLASITVRGLERDDRIVSFRVTIDDRPGVLGRIATTIGETGANILEVSHHRLFLDVPAKGASVQITVETRDAAHADEVEGALSQAGYRARRIAAAEASFDKP
jgi:threonine dehydratase